MTRVALVAVEDCAAYSLSTAAGLLRLANKANVQRGRRHDPFEWQVVSQDAAPVRTGVGLSIVADHVLGSNARDNVPFDVVCVPDLYFSGEPRLLRILAEAAPLTFWIRKQWQSGAILMAFGTGSFLLAESGLLDRRACTTSPALVPLFRTRYPRAMVRRDSGIGVARSDRMIFSATHPHDVEVLQNLISSQMDSPIAAQCARWILSDTGLSPGSSEMTLYVDTAVKDPITTRADRWIRRNLSRTARIEDMARFCGASLRSLYRHLRLTTGLTPAAYLQKRRMEAAQRLLGSTDLGIAEIARRVGYSDASTFSRVFRRIAGQSPARFRRIP